MRSLNMCNVDECGRASKSLGWCLMHYKRFKRNGDPKRLVVGIIEVCKIPDCDCKHAALGYCRQHYKRFRRFGDPLKHGSAEYHGMAETPEYRAWCHMKGRCYDKNDKYYKDYGGRGITVCNRWINSFRSFYEDMGSRPDSRHSLDRKDTNGNYEPVNCRWATAREQAVSRRIRRNNTSGYQGVSLNRRVKKISWIASIGVKGNRICLGGFSTAREAAIVYNEAVRKYHPIGATLNNIGD